MSATKPLDRPAGSNVARHAPTVLLSGMVAGEPWMGGLTWVVLNHLLGLASLGCEVHFVEAVPRQAIRPRGAPLEQSDNANYFRAVVGRYGLTGRATLVERDSHQTVGAGYGDLVALAGRADVLVNIAGMLTDPELTGPVPVRAYLDLDPGFTQLWQLQGIDMRLDGHTHFVTVGPRLGADGCPVPTLGRRWIGILPPVVLDRWPLAGAPACDAFTTVASWRGYGSVWHDGVHYGQKAHAARQLFPLPHRTGEKFLLALSIHPEERTDVAALDANGWRRVEPDEVARMPWDYERFVRASTAELGIAKAGYVTGRSGWFSDRSVCYLASGRPVLAQDTGFSAHLPTGEGLLAFDDLDSAAAGVAAIRGDYARHARAARALAEDHFDARRVIAELLERLGTPA